VSTPRIAAMVLAAGSSSRMPGTHKLLEDLDGKPVVCWAVDSALASTACEVSVVVGSRARDVEGILPDGVRRVCNPQYSDGLSSSLKAGVRALPDDVDGVLVLLGDMPFVTTDLCDALIAEYAPDRVCVPMASGRRGNPVLWPRSFFDDILRLTGDCGARQLMAQNTELVREIDVADDGVLVDIDVLSDLQRARSRG